MADAHPNPDIVLLCEQAKLDFGFVPGERGFADFRLLVMDMDSTLITIETIDELADMVGSKGSRGHHRSGRDARRARIRREPRAAASPLLERARRRMRSSASTTSVLRLRRAPKAAGSGAQALGLKTLLVSGGFTYVTDRLKKRLQPRLLHARTASRSPKGKLTGKRRGARS